MHIHCSSNHNMGHGIGLHMISRIDNLIFYDNKGHHQRKVVTKTNWVPSEQGCHHSWEVYFSKLRNYGVKNLCNNNDISEAGSLKSSPLEDKIARNRTSKKAIGIQLIMDILVLSNNVQLVSQNL